MKRYNSCQCWPAAKGLEGMEHSPDHRPFIPAGDIATASAARVRCRFALVLGLAGCIATSLSAQSGADEHTLLEPGKTIERQLAGGQSHEYSFMLQAGQFAKVW